MTLEETLEILGAGQLKMDDGRRPLINNDSRGAAAEASKNKNFALRAPARAPVGAAWQLRLTF